MIARPLGALLVAVSGIGAVVCTAITWWPTKKSGPVSPPSSSAREGGAPGAGPDLSLSGPTSSLVDGLLASGGESERVPLGSDERPLGDGWPHPRRFFSDGDAA